MKDFSFDLSLHFKPCKELLHEAFSCVYMYVYEMIYDVSQEAGRLSYLWHQDIYILSLVKLFP